MYVWIEFLRQNKSGVTDRTGDRTDRTGIESKKSLEKDDEQNNAILAGKGGLLSKIETGVIRQDRRGRTEGRQERQEKDRETSITSRTGKTGQG